MPFSASLAKGSVPMDVVDAFDALFGPSKVAPKPGGWVKVKPQVGLPALIVAQQAAYVKDDYARVARAYGFTPREIEAWVRANDAGVPFEVLADILAATPVPHTTQYTPDRRKQEAALIARLHTAMVKVGKSKHEQGVWGVSSVTAALAKKHKAHTHTKPFHGSDPLSSNEGAPPSLWHIPSGPSPSQAAVEEIEAIANAGIEAYKPEPDSVLVLGAESLFKTAIELLVSDPVPFTFSFDVPPKHASDKLWVVKDGVARPPTGCETCTTMPVLWKNHPAFPGFVLPQ